MSTEGGGHHRGTSRGGIAAQIVNVADDEENREINLTPRKKKKFKPLPPKRKKPFGKTRRGGISSTGREVIR